MLGKQREWSPVALWHECITSLVKAAMGLPLGKTSWVGMQFVPWALLACTRVCFPMLVWGWAPEAPQTIQAVLLPDPIAEDTT